MLTHSDASRLTESGSWSTGLVSRTQITPRTDQTSRSNSPRIRMMLGRNLRQRQTNLRMQSSLGLRRKRGL